MTTTVAALPAPKDICDLLSMLFGRDVTSAPGAPVPVTLNDPAVVAVYVDQKLTMHAVVILDIALAAACGAALGLLPPHTAELAATSKALPDALGENASEVLNVMTPLLTVPDAPQFRLYRSYQPGERLPADVASLASMFGRRLDLTLSMGAYGRGAMSVVLD